jgi:dihydroxy-acid dehydratase
MYHSLSYAKIVFCGTKTPFLADLKPSGKFVMEDVQNIGGTPGMIKFLIDNDMFDGDQMTVTGKTHKQNLLDMNHPGLTPGQEIIRPLSDPIKATGHLQIMYGNLCPGGGVAKITGKEGETFTVSRHRKINFADRNLLS